MTKFFKTLILFFILFFIVDKLFYFKLNKLPNQENDKRLELLINGEINKEIIILGSSRAQNNIFAYLIEKKTNMSCFNLGYQGSNLDFQLFVLKTLLKYNAKPKHLLLVLDDEKELYNDKSLNFRFDRLFPLVKYNYYYQELIERKQISLFANFFYSARLNKNSFKFLRSFDHIDKLLPCGSASLDTISPNPNFNFIKNKNYDEKQELPEKLIQFQEIQQICKNKGIKLTYIFPPNFKYLNKQFENRIDKLKFSTTNKYVYNKNDKRYLEKPYFYNESHLNDRGAKVFTNEIAEFLNKNHEKSSHYTHKKRI